jgi:gluconate kinase
MRVYGRNARDERSTATLVHLARSGDTIGSRERERERHYQTSSRFSCLVMRLMVRSDFLF